MGYKVIRRLQSRVELGHLRPGIGWIYGFNLVILSSWGLANWISIHFLETIGPPLFKLIREVVDLEPAWVCFMQGPCLFIASARKESNCSCWMCSPGPSRGWDLEVCAWCWGTSQVQVGLSLSRNCAPSSTCSTSSTFSTPYVLSSLSSFYAQISRKRTG